MNCVICPRNCNIDRSKSQGYCKTNELVKVARADLHMWEEPCISGEEGSGTIFFSGCNLRCVYCQNHEISGGLVGKDISIERLSELMIELQNKGANNINLVTPSHFLPQIKEAIRLAKTKGLNLPIVYNTSSYEKSEYIQQLKGYIDVYLPDFKYYDNELAKKYSNAPNYREIATKALDEMLNQVDEQFNDKEIMTGGVIVRHLILPGNIDDSKKVIKYLYDRYGDRIYISIMNQFTPIENMLTNYPELNRKVTDEEYGEVVDYALEIGVEKGFIQEGETATESFIPKFDFKG